MAVGWLLGKLFAAAPSDVEATAVNCSTCPVSLACLAERGGTGVKCPQCGATGVEDLTGPTRSLLIMDCANNRFGGTGSLVTPEFSACPLCNGHIVKAHFLGHAATHRYVLTVHAKVDFKTRQVEWRRLMPEAEKFKQAMDAAKAARKT